jgi:pyruvate/2-oxoacid:ferredoxin oxidoreductase beta subunit/intein/homing endonuclease
VANNTGCLEVFSTRYPESSWEIPWIHSLFENAAAVASGIESALIYLGKSPPNGGMPPKAAKESINVIAQAGDGGTADIGLQALSGMWERGGDILSVCFDNEAYENCLSTSVLIFTKEGLKRITEVKVGDEIYAFDQKTYQLVTKKCTGIFDNGEKEVFELQTLHHSIKATKNHPFLVLKRNGRGRENELVWKKLEDINIGDQIVVLKKMETSESFKFKEAKLVKKGDYKVNKLNEVNLPQISNPDLMRFLGIYVGDGWIRKDRGEFGFAIPQDSEERECAVKILNETFNIKKFSEDKNYIYVNSINLVRFIDSLGFGQGAKNKTIPSWIFTLPYEEKEAFVDGLMLSDGYKIDRSHRYASVSFDLLRRLRLLLQTLGYRVGKIHRQVIKKGSFCVYRKLLKDSEFGYICYSQRRKWNLKKYPSQYKYQNLLIENEFFEMEIVRSIKPVGIESTLDLRVEDEHNFIADGIVVHNTGIQRSGLTPYGTNTTTSPPGTKSIGNPRPKKPMPEIALAHGIPYVATASVAFIADLQRKVKKALSIKGPKYIQIHVPCPLGWRHEPNLTYEVAKLAVETGLMPLIEYENGKLVSVRKIKPLPVEEYLKTQARFKHLLDKPEELKKIQAIADNNIEKYNLRLEASQN